MLEYRLNNFDVLKNVFNNFSIFNEFLNCMLSIGAKCPLFLSLVQNLLSWYFNKIKMIVVIGPTHCANKASLITKYFYMIVVENAGFCCFCRFTLYYQLILITRKFWSPAYI